VSAAAQLARIAALDTDGVPVAEVLIYQVSRGFELWGWWCRPCLEAMKAEGWERRATKVPPHPLACDRCHKGGAE
jgi:hypothetical protein